MNKFIVFLVAFLSIVFLSPIHALAQAGSGVATTSASQPSRTDYFRAEVVEIVSTGYEEVGGYKNFTQQVVLTIQSGYERGRDVLVEYGGGQNVANDKKLSVGDDVVVVKNTMGKTEQYHIHDQYRLGNVLYILVAFFILAGVVGGKKSFGSMLGLVFGGGVILYFIVPQIIQGRNPLVVSIVGSVIILFVAIYLAHGFSKKTTVAVVSTAISLIAAGVISFLFVELANLTGLGSEDAYSLQFGSADIDLKGLLLGGMIISALGILDDITTAQSAVVFELGSVMKKKKAKELFIRGMRIGREHVSSLVNTLVLVYAGVSLPLFIIFVLNPSHQPAWVLLNYELVIEEIVRAVSGSISLILAVPITTLLAAIIVSRQK